MPYLNDRVLDNGLTVLDTEATHLYITSQEAATYAEASSTYALGVTATVSVGAPAARTPSGRKVTVAAVTDGEVTATATASHYALVDSSNSRLLAADALAAPQAVTDGNTWTLPAFDIGIPGPA